MLKKHERIGQLILTDPAKASRMWIYGLVRERYIVQNYQADKNFVTVKAKTDFLTVLDRLISGERAAMRKHLKKKINHEKCR